MEVAQEINLQPMNEPPDAQVSVYSRRRIKIISAIGALLGMILFLTALLVPILVTKIKYTTTTTITTATTTTVTTATTTIDTTTTASTTSISSTTSTSDTITTTTTDTTVNATSSTTTSTTTTTETTTSTTSDTTTTSSSTTSSTTTASYPPFLDAQSSTIYALWNTVAGGANTQATAGTTGAGTYYTGDPPDNLFDDNLNTTYSSRGNSTTSNNNYAGLNTGFYLTVAQCQPVLVGFRFGNAYSYSEREPLRVTIEGTNCASVGSCTNWTLLYNGSTGLDIQENSLDYGYYQPISNSDIYKSYRFLITAKRNISTYVTYSEVELYGYSNQTASGSTGSINSTSLFVTQSGSTQPLWNTFAGGNSTIAVSGMSGAGTYYPGQSSDNLFDNNTNTKFTSRGNSNTTINTYSGLNTGFYVTIAQCQPTLVMFRLATAASGSSTARDPTMMTVEGTNCDTLSTCTMWTLLYNDTSGLENVLARSTYGVFKSIPSPQAFTSYRFLVTAKRNSSDYVAYSEAQLYGY